MLIIDPPRIANLLSAGQHNLSYFVRKRKIKCVKCVKCENPKTNVWYKKQRLGVNSIDNMMKSVVKNTALETSKKKLTNHTARKTVVKKLRAASVERQSIIQVTGHASEKSLNDYDEGSEKEQRQLSNIISIKHYYFSYCIIGVLFSLNTVFVAFYVVIFSLDGVLFSACTAI